MEKILGKEETQKLLVSLKTPRKWRVLDPIEIAERLELLCRHYPRDEVARRVGISREGTLWVYFKLLTLPQKVQRLVRAGKIGQDAAYRISILKEPKEQEVLADAVVKHRLTSKEVKGIVQNLKKRNRQLPIDECINLALRARPSVSEEHIVLTSIRNETLQLIEKRSDAEGLEIADILKKSLVGVISPKGISTMKLVKNTIIMSLSKEDFRSFRKRAKEEKVKLVDLVDTLVRRIMD